VGERAIGIGKVEYGTSVRFGGCSKVGKCFIDLLLEFLLKDRVGRVEAGVP
jgi:hypothetical protein